MGEFLRLGWPFPLTRLVLVVLGFISCVHPRWFNPPLRTNASFLHFFTFFSLAGTSVCDPVVSGAAGTSGVFMYCFGTLRELPGKNS